MTARDYVWQVLMVGLVAILILSHVTKTGREARLEASIFGDRPLNWIDCATIAIFCAMLVGYFCGL